MAKDILKRLEMLENDEIIEIEDISMYEKEIFGDDEGADDEKHNREIEKA